MITDQPMRAPCPKCQRQMIYVTAVPHPRASEMRQTTFVCYPCNRTFNYVLSSEMAAGYATEAAEAATA
jgi:transposase-like protein